MKLLLADDHAMFRDALVDYLQRTELNADVTIAKDMNEVMEVMQGGDKFDLVMLDFRMPGMDDLRGLESLLEHYPDTRAVILSGMARTKDVEKAMDMGAAGYLPKTLTGKALINGINKVMAGEKYVAIDYNTNEIMASSKGHEDEDADVADSGAKADLTPRESEVLEFLLRGASNKEIARSLDLQVVTVKLHVRGICRKLGAKNRTQAALKAQQMGLTG
ncbi:MAG TPA: response regulator transcription factor [Micavibrio sp.]|nr:response regulator transcription factor [Micavibrio sp.]HIL27706.1 response regulator transcription factor [Micavibrio sp.]